MSERLGVSESAGVPVKSDMVQIVNQGRDRVFFDVPVYDTDGKSEKRNGAGKPIRERIVLGSRDDKGVVDTAQPEIKMAGKTWDILSRQKGVKGLLEQQSISVYQIPS